MSVGGSGYEETKHDPELNAPLPGWLAFWYDQWNRGTIGVLDFGRQIAQVIEARKQYKVALQDCLDAEEDLEIDARKMMVLADNLRHLYNPK